MQDCLSSKYAIKPRRMESDGKARLQNKFNVTTKICFFNTSTVSGRRPIRADCAAQLKAARFVFDQSGASLLCADQSGLAIPQLRPITRRLCISSSQSQHLKLPLNHEQNQSKTFAGCFRHTNVLREEIFSDKKGMQKAAHHDTNQ